MVKKLITGPTVEPITLAQAKAHLRVDFTDDDLWITSAIVGCRLYAEKFMGRALVQQTWELSLDEFPEDEIEMPLPPLQSIVSVKYDDVGGVEQTISASSYRVDTYSEPGRIFPTSSWPSTLDKNNVVRVRFIAGYPSTLDSPDNLVDMIPQSIKNAILLHIGMLYANREQSIVGTTAVILPWGGADELLRQFLVEVAMA